MSKFLTSGSSTPLRVTHTHRCAYQMLAQVSLLFQNPTVFLLLYVDRKCRQLIIICRECLPFQRQDCYNSSFAYPSKTFRQAGQGDLLLFVYQDCFQLLSSDGSCELHRSLGFIVQLKPQLRQGYYIPE